MYAAQQFRRILNEPEIRTQVPSSDILQNNRAVGTNSSQQTNETKGNSWSEARRARGAYLRERSAHIRFNQASRISVELVTAILVLRYTIKCASQPLHARLAGYSDLLNDQTLRNL